jgi:hypothetical protein
MEKDTDTSAKTMAEAKQEVDRKNNSENAENGEAKITEVSYL